jgi:hypothetical protein
MANFGERQVMAEPVARKQIVSPLIHKDFRVRYSLLARGDFAAADLNHQNWTRTQIILKVTRWRGRGGKEFLPKYVLCDGSSALLVMTSSDSTIRPRSSRHFRGIQPHDETWQPGYASYLPPFHQKCGRAHFICKVTGRRRGNPPPDRNRLLLEPQYDHRFFGFFSCV